MAQPKRVQIKNALMKRVNELHAMPDEQVLGELKKVFPNISGGSREAHLMVLIKDAIDNALPDFLPRRK